MPFLNFGDNDPIVKPFLVEPSKATPRRVPKLETKTLGGPPVNPYLGRYKTPVKRKPRPAKPCVMPEKAGSFE